MRKEGRKEEGRMKEGRRKEEGRREEGGRKEEERRKQKYRKENARKKKRGRKDKGTLYFYRTSQGFRSMIPRRRRAGVRCPRTSKEYLGYANRDEAP